MFQKLEEIVSRFEEVESRLADPDLAKSPVEFKRLSQEHAHLAGLVADYRRFKDLDEELKSNKELLADGDDEIVQMAKDEIKRLEPEVEQARQDLQIALLPQDPNDGKNIILEIRAGAGGDEAGLFAAEMFRMYQRFAEKQGWKSEGLSSHASGIGGYKEVTAMITGDRVYSRMKYEAGVHRVQRVPDTETQGRVHTSTVTVAILPEAEEVDININPADLRIDVYRSSGAGGQHVNTTDSAVRITHAPSGVVVTCQDERSQHKNKDKAMKILRSRILEAEQAKAAKEHSDARKTMVGTGDRSERIRTYNFPQGRITDHRIGLTSYDLPEVMEGKIEGVITALTQFYQMESLKSQGMGGGDA